MSRPPKDPAIVERGDGIETEEDLTLAVVISQARSQC